MDMYTACECAYSNGFEAGRRYRNSTKLELVTRIKVAYEQLSKCHMSLCRTISREDDNSALELMRDVLSQLLELQVKLDTIEEDVLT